MAPASPSASVGSRHRLEAGSGALVVNNVDPASRVSREPAKADAQRSIRPELSGLVRGGDSTSGDRNPPRVAGIYAQRVIKLPRRPTTALHDTLTQPTPTPNGYALRSCFQSPSERSPRAVGHRVARYLHIASVIHHRRRVSAHTAEHSAGLSAIRPDCQLFPVASHEPPMISGAPSSGAL